MPMPLLRLIDANANRAREAMRVMEDAARFMLDDAPMSERAKRLRHDLAAALRVVPDLPLHRDTPGDVGAAITTAAESARHGPGDVVVAAGKRLSEALRAIEEYAKVLGPDVGAPLAREVERIRYEGYELETRLTRRVALPDPRRWRVCVIVTESLCTHHGWRDVAAAAIDAGAQCIQLREKDLHADELVDRTRQLVELARAHPAAILVNDRADVAVAAGAHGVHLGQHDLSAEDARRIAGRSLLIGASTHNLREARRAKRDAVDYCGVGAIFPSTTKSRRPSGLDYLARFIRDHPDMPHLAIGGVTPDNVDRVAQAGASAVAVSSCACAAKRPDKIVRQLLQALRA